MKGEASEAAHRSEVERIDFIDGFRGLAVILVVGYHYFCRFADDPRAVYPYGDSLASLPIFSYGYYGVHLFFAVSGFVIAMTLERAKTLLEFGVKRFARLWPAMLLCASISYSVLSLWPTYWPQRPENFLPSLTFMDGAVVWEKVFPGLNATWIDGAYWSLFVEIRFYFYAGLLYFISAKHFARNMLGFLLAAVTIYAVCLAAEVTRWSAIVQDLMIATHLPWFGAGLAAFEAWRGRIRRSAWFASASLGGVGVMNWLGEPAMSLSVMVAVLMMFAGCLWLRPVRKVFSARWLAMVGLSSYSLYLLHQNVGLTLIGIMAERFDLYGQRSVLLPVLVGLTMTGLAFCIYRYWERPWNRRIVHWLNLLSDRRAINGDRDHSP